MYKLVVERCSAEGVMVAEAVLHHEAVYRDVAQSVIEDLYWLNHVSVAVVRVVEDVAKAMAEFLH